MKWPYVYIDGIQLNEYIYHVLSGHSVPCLPRKTPDVHVEDSAVIYTDFFGSTVRDDANAGIRIIEDSSGNRVVEDGQRRYFSHGADKPYVHGCPKPNA